MNTPIMNTRYTLLATSEKYSLVCVWDNLASRAITKSLMWWRYTHVH